MFHELDVMKCILLEFLINKNKTLISVKKLARLYLVKSA